ncbi:hypothetical protein L842_5130 [Mycobacterium intracellulare MIN_052511_1280]|nr:hypothetical protein L842_5130 [Mycobacterium intracellulare MIN_052511_1280]
MANAGRRRASTAFEWQGLQRGGSMGKAPIATSTSGEFVHVPE